MNYDGKHLIEVVKNRLDDEEYTPHDGGAYTNAILETIRNLSNAELNQIVSFGDVQKWHNERINNQQS